MAITLNEKEYVVRNLKTKDIPAVSRIVKKMNLKMDFEQIAKIVKNLSKSNEGFANRVMGIEMVLTVVSALGDAEDEFYSLLGDLVQPQLKADDIADLDIEDLAVLLSALKEQKGITSFLSFVSKTTK